MLSRIVRKVLRSFKGNVLLSSAFFVKERITLGNLDLDFLLSPSSLLPGQTDIVIYKLSEKDQQNRILNFRMISRSGRHYIADHSRLNFFRTDRVPSVCVDRV